MNKNILKIIIIVFILALAPCESFAGEKDSIQLFFVNPLENKKPVNTCNNGACKALLREINNAKESIDFAIYGIGGEPKIFNALVEAQKRGVIVRGVTDVNIENQNTYRDTDKLIKVIKDIKTDYAEDFKTLNSLRNEYRSTFLGNLMHNKFFIFDGKAVWTGSTNVSNGCMSYNANNSILIKSKTIADLYLQEFNQMYAGKFHRSKSSISNNENLKLDDGTKISVYFLPENNAIDNRIVPLIDRSKNYIHISIFYLTHQKIIDALIAAHNRGVKVKIIVDATSAANPYSKHKTLRQSGILVKVENWGGKMHMKSMIADDKYSVIGSMNWTASAQKNNDENTVIIENPEIAGKMENNFSYLWNSIPDKWLEGRPLPESPDSIGSCFDGMDNDHDGLTDSKDPDCKVYYKHSFKFFSKGGTDDGAD